MIRFTSYVTSFQLVEGSIPTAYSMHTYTEKKTTTQHCHSFEAAIVYYNKEVWPL